MIWVTVADLRSSEPALLPDLPNSESRSHIPSVAAKHDGVPLHQISLLLVFLRSIPLPSYLLRACTGTCLPLLLLLLLGLLSQLSSLLRRRSGRQRTHSVMELVICRFYGNIYQEAASFLKAVTMRHMRRDAAHGIRKARPNLRTASSRLCLEAVDTGLGRVACVRCNSFVGASYQREAWQSLSKW
jgi:hypothetical protein